jgi:hypothetical protein
VADGAARNVGLGHLAHGDGALDTGLDASLFQEVLQGQAVHDRSEHAHVVGAGAVHAALGELGPTEEVSAADDDGDFHLGDGRSDLLGDGADGFRVHTELAAAEDLAGKLQEHAALGLPVGGLWLDYLAGCRGRKTPGRRMRRARGRMQKGRPPK